MPLFPLTLDLGYDEVDTDEGHDWRGDYAEFFWLPIVGPSTLLLGRRLDLILEHQGVARVRLDELALDLGLGHGLAPNSPIMRTVDRLCRFKLARVDGNQLYLAPRVPNLPARSLDRLRPQLIAVERTFHMAEVA